MGTLTTFGGDFRPVGGGGAQPATPLPLFSPTALIFWSQFSVVTEVISSGAVPGKKMGGEPTRVVRNARNPMGRG